MGDRHRHVFIDDHVLDGDIFRTVDDLRAPFVAVFLLDLLQFLDDDLVDFFLVGQNGAQLRDQFDGFAMLLHDLAALQAGQALQPQIQDRLGLDLAQAEIGHQPFLGNFRVGGVANQCDDRIQIVERDAIAF